MTRCPAYIQPRELFVRDTRRRDSSSGPERGESLERLRVRDDPIPLERPTSAIVTTRDDRLRR